MEKTTFVEIANKIFNKKYNYSKVPKNFKTRDKLEIICPIHGSFYKSYNNHIHKKQGCSKCTNKNREKLKYDSSKFIEKLKELYGVDCFSFDSVVYNGIDSNIKIICKKCNNEFTVKARYALHKKLHCKNCESKITSKDIFIDKANKVHNNFYDYSKVNFIKSKYKVEIICPKHGSFYISPVLHVNKKIGCPKCAAGTYCLNEFKEIANKRFNGFYDYSKVIFNKNSDKIEIICPKHGSFYQTVSQHIHSIKPCPECRKTIIEKDNFIKMAQSIHGLKYDYSKINFKNMSTHIDVICPKHGIFSVIPNNHIHKKSRCPKCANEYNLSENELKSFISSFGFYVKENDRNTLKNDNKFLELDCFVPCKNVAFEFDGLFWHSFGKKGNTYHLNKTNECEKKGIRLIHIFEDEWLFKKGIVKSRIKAILGLTPYKIQARKCVVKEVSSLVSKRFIEKYHIQGNCQASIRLGLFYKNRLCAVMTFGKSRFNKKYDWEMLRYCTLSNFNVIGGAGKLLAHFRKNYIGSIVTYADKRWSDGNLYRQLGFTQLKDSPPAYWYFLGKKRFSRTLFQKHLLKKKLQTFDESKTEKENMAANGYKLIYDCGNYVFVLS